MSRYILAISLVLSLFVVLLAAQSNVSFGGLQGCHDEGYYTLTKNATLRDTPSGYDCAALKSGNKVAVVSCKTASEWCTVHVLGDACDLVDKLHCKGCIGYLMCGDI